MWVSDVRRQRAAIIININNKSSYLCVHISHAPANLWDAAPFRLVSRYGTVLRQKLVQRLVEAGFEAATSSTTTSSPLHSHPEPRTRTQQPKASLDGPIAKEEMNAVFGSPVHVDGERGRWGAAPTQDLRGQVNRGRLWVAAWHGGCDVA